MVEVMTMVWLVEVMTMVVLVEVMTGGNDGVVVLQVRDLCDEGSHDRWAPTRHNLICGGKSVWEVMRASPDFQNNR